MGPLPCDFGICFDEAAYRHALKKLKISEKHDGDWRNEAGAVCHQFEMVGGNNLAIVVLDSKQLRRSNHQQIAGLLTHECMHAWRFFLKGIGEKEPSSELEAYNMQYMVQFCFQQAMIRKKVKS
jgi:hypothetical protein